MIKIWKSDRKELQEGELRPPDNPEKQEPRVDRGRQRWGVEMTWHSKTGRMKACGFYYWNIRQVHENQ